MNCPRRVVRRLQHTARRYFHTVAPLDLRRQILGRLLSPIKRRAALLRLPDPPPTLRGGLMPAASFPWHNPWNTADDLRAGRFRFLNETRELNRPVNWDPPDPPPHLWKLNLHYFNYLFCLSEEKQKTLCRDWVASNPPGKGIGWHPYPTSLRIINWCKAQLQVPELLRSLYRQAAYLYRHQETHLLGNHLLENARALVFAGCFFGAQGEAPAWLERGLALYREQTPEQILPDGGHFERSPMYHALMLEGYLDVLNLLPDDHPDAAFFEDTAARMTGFLTALTHPGGRIALFNDAGREVAPPTETLVRYARALLPAARALPKPSAFPDTGYFVHERDGLYLALDGGPVGPDYLPAHAHADIFSYELSIEGLPFIVDSGAFEYRRGAMRDYGRSTPAHNTVCIDDTDQAECWRSFRVARRFAPRDVTFEQGPSGSCFSGCFDGYATLIGDDIRHWRTVEVKHRKQRLIVTDRVEGRGRHEVRSYIHLHPDVELQRDGRGDWLLRRGEGRCRLKTSDDAAVRQGWYCPAFGTRVRNDVLVLGQRTSLPARLSYELEYGLNHR